MAIELNADVVYDGSGTKKITFSDLRQTYKEIVAKAEEDRVDISFFAKMVKRMPSIGKLGVERVNRKFDHYFHSASNKDSEAVVVALKEIASMDTDLEVRIKRKCTELLNNLGTLANMQTVNVGKNREGEYVVKVIYHTAYQPDSGDAYNLYNEEREERTTLSDGFPSKEQALFYSMWLAGALNVRHVDEDTLPQ